MHINKHHGTFNRSFRSGGTAAIKYICIHYTGGTGSAKNNCIYFSGANRNASADYFIDDSGIWEYNDPDEGCYTWAVGDGKGAYGITNANSVSIEVVSNGEPFSAQEITYLAWLTQHLMAKYNVPANRVVRHYDASRKQCPYPYINQAKWNELHHIITEGADMPTVEEIWNFEQNGVKMRDRIQGIDDKTETLIDTSDPTKRVEGMSIHDQIRYMAEKQQKMLEIMERISDKVGV